MGRGGSGAIFGLIGTGWLGFHIALKAFPFLSGWDEGILRQGRCRVPQESEECKKA
jgi:hypothetical protein